MFMKNQRLWQTNGTAAAVSAYKTQCSCSSAVAMNMLLYMVRVLESENVFYNLVISKMSLCLSYCRPYWCNLKLLSMVIRMAFTFRFRNVLKTFYWRFSTQEWHEPVTHHVYEGAGVASWFRKLTSMLLTWKLYVPILTTIIVLWGRHWTQSCSRM